MWAWLYGRGYTCLARAIVIDNRARKRRRKSNNKNRNAF